MVKKISVVAPAHNEEESIEKFISKSTAAFRTLGLSGEILIVDDASTDKTTKIVSDIQKKNKLVKLISNKKKQGLTGASWIGFNNAKEDIIIFLPSDLGSDPEKDIPILIKPFDKGYDMVVSWKYGFRENIVKQGISKVFNFIARLVFRIPYHDLGWIKAFKKEVIKDMEIRSDWHRYFTVFAHSRGFKIKEVRTKYNRKRVGGSSKYGSFGLARIPGAIFDMIAIKFLLSFSKRPMQAFGVLGAFFIAVGLIGALYLVATKLMGASLTERIPMIFLLVILIISGTQLFALGFLAELLVSIREKIGKK